MNITILGGCGFIGSHLAEAFISEKLNVTIFDHNNADRTNLLKIEKKIRFLGGDFLNIKDIAQAVSGAEIVVHLISFTLPSNSLKNPAYDIETNIIASVNLLEECIRAKVRKVIFLSSGGTVYGIPLHLPIPETHPLNPVSPYGLSKMAIEKYLGLYSYHYGLDYTVLRLSNPYGVRQNPQAGQGVIATWVNQVKNCESIEIWGDGEIVRDYIYIVDAIDAIKTATLRGSDQKIFNVGSGKGYSLNQLHRIMEDAIGQEIPIVYKNGRKVDVPTNILDVSLIKDVYAWQAKASLKDGLQKLWLATAFRHPD